MDEAQHLCDRVGILDQGALIRVDTPQALLEQMGRFVVEHRQDDAPTQRRFFEDYDAALAHVATLGSDPGAQTQIRPAHLEDLFLELTGKRLQG